MRITWPIPFHLRRDFFLFVAFVFNLAAFTDIDLLSATVEGGWASTRLTYWFSGLLLVQFGHSELDHVGGSYLRRGIDEVRETVLGSIIQENGIVVIREMVLRSVLA